MIKIYMKDSNGDPGEHLGKLVGKKITDLIFFN